MPCCIAQRQKLSASMQTAISCLNWGSVRQAGMVRLHNRGTHRVHNGIGLLFLLSCYAIYINFKVGQKPGKIREWREPAQKRIIVYPSGF